MDTTIEGSKKRLAIAYANPNLSDEVKKEIEERRQNLSKEGTPAVFTPEMIECGNAYTAETAIKKEEYRQQLEKAFPRLAKMLGKKISVYHEHGCTQGELGIEHSHEGEGDENETMTMWKRTAYKTHLHVSNTENENYIMLFIDDIEHTGGMGDCIFTKSSKVK